MSICLAAASCGSSGPTQALTEAWQIQAGTDAGDTSFGVALGEDNDLIVVASTQGDLAGTNAGNRDVYISRRNTNGESLWELQIGGPGNDSPLGVSVAPDDSIYVAGFTDGAFASEHAGSADIWIARFSPTGEELWRSQFGGEAWDRGFDVVAFDGGAYVTGYTDSALDPATDLGGFDGFAARFSEDGELRWVTQMGTDETDWGQGGALAPDGGLYVTGYTEGAMDGPNAGDKDGFVVRIKPDGTKAWTRQLGSPGLDWPQGVIATDDQGVTITGSTEGDLNGQSSGLRDAFIARFTHEGDAVFVTQFGTELDDSAFEIRSNERQIVVTGSTDGDLAGGHGERDGFITWLDQDGTVTSTLQIGTSVIDDVTGLALTPAGDVFYSANTSGSLGGQNQGETDVVVGGFPPQL